MRSILASIELFSSLSTEELAQVEAIAIRRNIAKGVLLFNEGEPIEHLYVLIEGSLKLFHGNDSGREFVYGLAEPGAAFGDLALFDPDKKEVRQVSAEADEDCVVLAISNANFAQLLVAYPQMKDAMLRRAVEVIKHLTTVVSDLALKDVYGRVRNVFESLAVKTDEGWLIDDQLTQQDLADRVGASREMIAKVMKELVSGGYVQTGRRKILILKKLPERF
ncbi:Crp/Fnr family transcriptional regulator [Chitinibacter bivalviorum]|uniref:Crp/Fnr family transcriptional regulator n=1 Tax=Chitinibacter bivalviorum TaxID=2739434 RepID=A0A7H9BIS7_9NEIS|nr:Crp/Fnr family transcriptional regulator [Chitinibacter bivalviorum]QLG88379.1 Crp/Fnr family transcriptional regulator [Chitinibacter bivalviorum]